MTILDYCKGLVLFSNLQQKIIEILIQQYLQKDKQFSFLKEIDLSNIQFFWYKDSNEDVLGGFHFFGYSSKNQRYVVYINDIFNQQHNNDNSFSMVSLVFQTIIHQLKHYWQMKKLGTVIYFVLQLPIIRQFTIQNSASKVSNKIIQMKIGQKLIQPTQFLLKYKYNVSNIYLNEKELQLKTIMKQKNIDVNELLKNNFYTLNSIKQFVEK